MNTYLLLYTVLGVALGLLFTIKAIRDAEDDPETFDQFKNEGRFHKPANWKVGKMPENKTNKNTLHFESIPVENEYHQMYLN